MKTAVSALLFLMAGLLLAAPPDEPKEEEGGAQILSMEPAPVTPPASVPATLAGVKPGMTGRELLAKLGPPASRTETWTYGSGATAVFVTLRGGKVVAISRAARPETPKADETPDIVIIQ
jgi:hypothetical protein